MNKMDFIAKEEKEAKEKLEQGNLAVYTKFDFFNLDQTKKEHESYMLVTLTAPAMKTTVERKPLNISASLDISGSMDERCGMKCSKLDYVKKAMKKMVQHLTEKDILGIVTFATNVQEVFKSTNMTNANKDKVYKIIEGLHTQDMTNLSGGLFRSIEQLRETKSNEFINRIMLFTDGQTNQGITEISALSPLMIEQLASSSASFFGFGKDYNETMLTQLSKDGKGNLHHMMEAEDIPNAFAKELGGLLTVFAQNIEVSLDLGKEVELIENCNADTITEDKEKKIIVNDIYSQETRNLLFKVKIGKDANEKKIANVKVSYLDLIKNKKFEDEKIAEIRFVEKDKADELKDVDKDVAMQISIYEASKAQTQAMNFAKQGNFSAARNILNASAGTVGQYADIIDTGTILHDMANATGYYADSASFTANVATANAVRMDYASGRSVGGSLLSKKMKQNVVTESLMRSFTSDDEEKKA